MLEEKKSVFKTSLKKEMGPQCLALDTLLLLRYVMPLMTLTGYGACDLAII